MRAACDVAFSDDVARCVCTRFFCVCCAFNGTARAVFVCAVCIERLS
ncbi:MAG: hypothetical protein ACOX9C_07505 [Kiritimatiellia bacterium]